MKRDIGTVGLIFQLTFLLVARFEVDDEMLKVGGRVKIELNTQAQVREIYCEDSHEGAEDNDNAEERDSVNEEN